MMRQTRVARSPLDRVLGGICGGLGAYLGINAWWVRAAFVALAVLSGGVVALLYLVLWWVLPAYDVLAPPAGGRDLGRLLVVVLLMALAGAITVARGMGALTGPTDTDLFWPGMLLLTGLALLWRTLRA
ncbi:MAG: PspC domain-containing protein [Anaerolineae bacterium]|nr:PspC domain-containing protein [Anaerolineae bacterium]